MGLVMHLDSLSIHSNYMYIYTRDFITMSYFKSTFLVIYMHWQLWPQNATVDGRNPAPVAMENIPVFTWFYTFQVVGLGISEPSTVCRIVTIVSPIWRCISYWKWGCSHVMLVNSGVTPWKINMEHTNHPFRKENDLPNPYDYVPY